MANPYFRFKQFTIRHDRCAMKVGTDGVLLGAWSNVSGAKRILDVGTGTGLVALMIAQRSDAALTALEIDESAVWQAKENVAVSPWADRVEVVHADFTAYRSPVKFDVVVSNPPYFVDSLKCPEAQRSTARHEGELNYRTLFQGVSRLLAADGRCCLIVPTDVSEAIIDIAVEVHLYPAKQLNILTAPGKAPKRTLFEFVFSPCTTCLCQEMLIEEARHTYSPEYIALTQAYYLNM